MSALCQKQTYAMQQFDAVPIAVGAGSSEWPNRRCSPRRTPRLFRQPGLAQALGPAGEVFRPPIRPQYKSQIGNAQRGIELPQPRQGFLCLLRPPGKPVACSGDAQYIDEIGAV